LVLLLLQLSPAFSPYKHKLVELEHLIDMLRDINWRLNSGNRNWVIGEQLRETVRVSRTASRDFR